MFDRKAFFDGVRPMFGGFSGVGGPAQIKGLDFLLDHWLALPARPSVPKFAYMLATVFHETARTMQPVIETFNLHYDKPGANPSVETAIARLENAWARGGLPWVKTPYWRKDARGRSWLGRGYVQLTWEPNYLTAQQKTGIRCHDDPALMLVPEHAVIVLFDGMKGGWFTGKSLDLIDDHVDGDELRDFTVGRTIINGVDHAAEIAQTGMGFLRALQRAGA
jgi:hypothetical protein